MTEDQRARIEGSRGVNLCAGQIRVTVPYVGAITVDPSNVTEEEVLRYAKDKLEALEFTAETLRKIVAHFEASVRLTKRLRECDI